MITSFSGCPCRVGCPDGCTGCSNSVCFPNAVLVLASEYTTPVIIDFDGKIMVWNTKISIRPFQTIDFDLGNFNDDLDFEFGPGTNARNGCGVTFMDRFWYFGGTENQVNTKIFQLNYQFLFQIFCLHVNDFFRVLFLRSAKLLDAGWKSKQICHSLYMMVHVIRFCIQHQLSYFVLIPLV